MKPPATGRHGDNCFLDSPPLAHTKDLARRYGCDLAIPNDAGVGNVLMYTRVVDDLAFFLGRPLRLLTAPLQPPIGTIDGEEPHPIWRANPCVSEIRDADQLDPAIMRAINAERDNLCQFNHVIENIAIHYGLRPRQLKPSLYLEHRECRWALEQLRTLPRPIVCVHPHGTSAPLAGHPWFELNWQSLLSELRTEVTAIEVGLFDRESKDLPTWKTPTTLRQMFALVWASDLFVGFDSCVAHVATAFDRPAAVLWDPFRKLEIEEEWQRGFGPAAVSRWAYPQNRNLMLLGDRDDTILRRVAGWIRDTVRSLHA